MSDTLMHLNGFWNLYRKWPFNCVLFSLQIFYIFTILKISPVVYIYCRPGPSSSRYWY